MIKFFRNVRQQMLTENKFSKYLIYAIGEIFLVVIGIIIALQFNNRNEQRKHLQTINETITAIEGDLIYNFKDATHVLDFYKMQDSIMKNVLYQQYTIQDYRKNEMISIVSGNWNIHTAKTENIDALLEKEEHVTKELLPIFDAVKRLVSSKKIADQSWNTLYENIQQNIETLTQQTSLVKLDSVSLEQRFHYMLTNPEYKKLVELNWIHTQNFYDLLSRFRAHNIAVLSTIKMVREKYKTPELEKLYQSLGMNPFRELDCNLSTNIKNNELRRGYLIGNISKKKATLRTLNNGKTIDIYNLDSGEFRDTRAEYAGLGGDYTVLVEQIDQKGDCFNQFVAVNKGYILLD